MKFTAIDVETANPDMASICQIGVARFSEGRLVNEWISLIDPEDYFDSMNISIHGISEIDVVGCPTFPEIIDQLNSFMSGEICVCHTHFDRVSISQAFEKYRLKQFDTVWLDSARVARRTWEDCAWSGYGLLNVSRRIGYEFRHHNALEDAKACGQILLAASQVTGLDIDEWLRRVEQPIDPSRSSRGSKIRREGNPEGEFYGEVVVFTGALEIARREAADLAAELGCSVAPGVTKKTSILVVGDQDISRLAGKKKSNKHLKAEKLILGGQGIRILKESDFMELFRQAKSIS